MATEVEEDIDLVGGDRLRAFLRLGQGDVAPDVAEGFHLLGRRIVEAAEIVAVDLEAAAVGDGEELHHEAAHDMLLEVRRQVADADLLMAAMKLARMADLLSRPEKLVIDKVLPRQLFVADMRQIVADHEIVAVELPLLREVWRERDCLAVSAGGLFNAADEVQEVAVPATEETLLARVKLRCAMFQQVFRALDSFLPSPFVLQNGQLFRDFGEIFHPFPCASFFCSTARQ